MEKLNQWLTLIANLGVLIGIVFLSLEISQSNRIAISEAGTELQAIRLELNKAAWENTDVAELMVKLRDIEPGLTPVEEYKALSFAYMRINQAISINISFDNGFITEDSLQRNIRGELSVIRRLPGLIPYLKQAIEEFGLTDAIYGPDASDLFRDLGNEIRRIEQN